jgi:polyhydroxybutyrate depolymerase
LTLRPLLASIAVTALTLIACSKGSSEEEAPTDTPPTTESDSTGKKKPQSTDINTPSVPDGTETPINPGEIPDETPTDEPDEPGSTNGVSNAVSLSEVTITVRNNARKYILAVPKNYDAERAYPLVVALHGDGGSAKSFVGGSKMTIATTDQAIVAFPDKAYDLFTEYDNNTDQRLVGAIIAQVKRTKNIDENKIWGFGHSKGAFMLNELGCRRPGLFNAIAPHAGGAPQEASNDIDACPDAQSLAVFVTMGTDDNEDGGDYEAEFWRRKSGCSSSKEDTDIDQCRAFKSCDQPVVYCKLEGQGHNLYSSAAKDSWNWFNSL